MENVFRIVLFLTGIVTFLPSFLVFLPEKIKEAYGVDIENADVELLLRHRAVLFGIVGGIMLFSAISKK
jgi:hypothetical protein